jgi:hypothetical protein
MPTAARNQQPVAEHRLSPLIARFTEIIAECKAFNGLFTVV